jgi:hypothetical protein
VPGSLAVVDAPGVVELAPPGEVVIPSGPPVGGALVTGDVATTGAVVVSADPSVDDVPGAAGMDTVDVVVTVPGARLVVAPVMAVRGVVVVDGTVVVVVRGVVVVDGTVVVVVAAIVVVVGGSVAAAVGPTLVVGFAVVGAVAALQFLL